MRAGQGALGGRSAANPLNKYLPVASTTTRAGYYNTRNYPQKTLHVPVLVNPYSDLLGAVRVIDPSVVSAALLFAKGMPWHAIDSEEACESRPAWSRYSHRAPHVASPH